MGANGNDVREIPMHALLNNPSFSDVYHVLTTPL